MVEGEEGDAAGVFFFLYFSLALGRVNERRVRYGTGDKDITLFFVVGVEVPSRNFGFRGHLENSRFDIGKINVEAWRKDRRWKRLSQSL